jgi:hypothetical protein
MKKFILFQTILFTIAVGKEISSEKLVGVATQFWNHNINIEESIARVDSMGFNSIRDGIKWKRVERSPNIYKIPKKELEYINEATNNNISPLIVLTGQIPKFYNNTERHYHPDNVEPFIQFIEFVAEYFKGRVFYYEIGNEWNTGGGLRKYPKKKKEKIFLMYLDLLKKINFRINKIDPNIKIVGPVFTGNGVKRGDLEFMAKNGLSDAVDIVSFHGYPYKEKNKIDQTPQKYFNWIESVEKMLVSYNNGKEVPIFVSEYAWPSREERKRYSHFDASEVKQKQYLLESLELAQKYTFIKGMWWFCLYDHVTIGGEKHYGGATFLGLYKLDDEFNIIEKLVVPDLIRRNR